jgi:hypothetical protein
MIVRGGTGLTLLFHTFLVRNALVIPPILAIEFIVGEIKILLPGFNTSEFSAKRQYAYNFVT